MSAGPLSDPLVQGDKLARPLNAPAAGQAVPGVQAGVGGSVVTATRVIIFGDNGELLAYSGTPQFGNLLASVSGNSFTDPYGNFVSAGITLYGSSGSAVQLYQSGTEASIFLLPGGAASLVIPPQLFSFAINAGGAAEIAQATLSSGTEGAGADAGVQCLSQSADLTVPARVILEMGGIISAVFATAFIQVYETVSATAPGTGSIETWHAITLDSGWSTAGGETAQYRMLPDGNVQVRGDISHTGVTAQTNINSSNPIPSAYWPGATRYYRPPQAADGAGAVQVSPAGVFIMRASGFTATQAILDGTYSI